MKGILKLLRGIALTLIVNLDIIFCKENTICMHTLCENHICDTETSALFRISKRTGRKNGKEEMV